MRVALLGNMNNNHFAMARYLRERGVDAHLLLFDNELEHFHPAADTYDASYAAYTHQLSWGSSIGILRVSRRQVLRDLAPYDVLIGCGFAPAYCERAGRMLDVFVPYGGDIWIDTFYRLVRPHLLPAYWAAVFYQRRGIPRCRVIHMPAADRLYEAQYQKYKGASVRWIEGIPMVHSPTYRKSSLEAASSASVSAQKFRELRDHSDLMIVYHARHYWQCDLHDANAKGTDKLFKAWALFRQRRPGVRAVLATFEYGKDVEQSKALANELKISNSVVWLPKMSRKDVMIGLNLADIVCGEFEHSWMTSGVLYEALVAGKPILAWRDDAFYRTQCSDLYPILNARHPEEIASRLEEYLLNSEAAKRNGQIGRDWYEREVVAKALDRYAAFIDERQRQLTMHPQQAH